jgi:LPS-assembly protein
VKPVLSWDLTHPGYYLRPSLAWDLTGYQLRHTAAGADTTPTRNLPIAIFDTALQFERDAGQNSVRQITLEPRLYYVYVPYRDQAALPVFDSGLPDPNFLELFRANRYVGADRIGDANDLTWGVTARMYQSATGQRYLSATIGQTVLLIDPRVSLPGEILPSSARSDLIANIDLAAYRNWSLKFDLAWNQEVAQTDKSQISLQYRPAGNQVVNLGYRFDRGTDEQADASIAWPLGKHWDAYGRSIYSLIDHKAIENFVGFQYRGSCWGVRVVARDSVSNRTGARGSSIYLELELNGLSSVGTGTASFLQASIQGYSATSISR